MHSTRGLTRATGSRPIAISAQRGHPVVRQHPFPHQIPNCLERLSGITSSHTIVKVLKKRSAVALQIRDNLRLLACVCGGNRNNVSLLIPQSPLCWLRRCNRPQDGQLLCEIESNPSIP